MRVEAIKIPGIESVAAGQLQNPPPFHGENAEQPALRPKGIPGLEPLVEEIDRMVKMLRSGRQAPLNRQLTFVGRRGPQSGEAAFQLNQCLEDEFQFAHERL